MQIDEDATWQDPIIDYLMNENLSREKSKARKIKRAARYYMFEDHIPILISPASSTRKLSKCSAKFTMANVEITMGLGHLPRRL
ncbi:unnamed protein product [Prunus armeniaca]